MSEQYIYDAYYAGLEKAAADAGMSKEAFGGLIGGLSALGKGIATVGKGAWTPMSTAWKAMASPLEKGVSAGGGVIRRGLNKAMPAGMAKHVNPFLDIAGKNMPRDMVNFGLFGGGIGAATADEGKRMEGFGKGLLGGAISGVGWTGTQNLLSKGVMRGLSRYGGQKGMAAGKFLGQYGVNPKASIFGKGRAGWTGTDRLKTLGGKAMMTAVPTVGAYFASGAMTPEFGEGEEAEPAAMEMPQQAAAQPTSQNYMKSPYFRGAATGAFRGAATGGW